MSEKTKAEARRAAEEEMGALVRKMMEDGMGIHTSTMVGTQGEVAKMDFASKAGVLMRVYMFDEASGMGRRFRVGVGYAPKKSEAYGEWGELWNRDLTSCIEDVFEYEDK